MVFFSCLIAFSLFIHVSSAGCAKSDIANDPNGNLVFHPDTDPVTVPNDGKVSVQCNKAGYQSRGGTARTLKCKDDKWQGTIHTCQPAQCPKKHLNCILLENGSFKLTPNTPEEAADNGTLAHAVCNKGYQLIKKGSDGQYRDVDQSDDAMQKCHLSVWDGHKPSVLGYKCVPRGQVLIVKPSLELYDIKNPANSKILTTELGGDRQAHAAGVFDHGIVAIVGGEKDGSYTRDTDLYDTKEDKMIAIGPQMEYKRRHISAVMLNNEMIVCGGIIPWPTGDGISNLCEKLTYNESSGQFQMMRFDKHLSVLRYGHAMARLNDDLYAIGGVDPSHIAVNTAERYTGVTWNATAPMSTNRVYLAAAQLDGFIYACGGTADVDDINARMKSCEKYDPASNSWGAIADLNKEQQGFSLVSLGGTLYSFGEFGHVEYYDAENDKWINSISLIGPHTVYAKAVQLKAV